MAQLEQVAAGRSAGGLSGQHRVGGEQCREHDDVAQQEDPKPVSDDDAYRRRTAAAVAAHYRRYPRPGELGSACLGAHAKSLSCGRARSARPNCSPDTSSSTRSIQPKASRVSTAHASPKIASHQMCQIRAKPVTTAKKAGTNPLGLF